VLSAFACSLFSVTGMTSACGDAGVKRCSIQRGMSIVGGNGMSAQKHIHAAAGGSLFWHRIRPRPTDWAMTVAGDWAEEAKAWRALAGLKEERKVNWFWLSYVVFICILR